MFSAYLVSNNMYFALLKRQPDTACITRWAKNMPALFISSLYSAYLLYRKNVHCILKKVAWYSLYRLLRHVKHRDWKLCEFSYYITATRFCCFNNTDFWRLLSNKIQKLYEKLPQSPWAQPSFHQNWKPHNVFSVSFLPLWKQGESWTDMGRRPERKDIINYLSSFNRRTISIKTSQAHTCLKRHTANYVSFHQFKDKFQDKRRKHFV